MPSLSATSPARFVTIPFSHYCEKARWALDYAGVPYVEEKYLPGVHIRPMRAAGGRTVPVLVAGDRTLTDSADILRYCDEAASADRKLYPADPAARREVEAVEAICNDTVGVAARLLVYHHGLPSPWMMMRAVRPSLTRAQAVVFPFALPFVRGLIRKRYKVDEAHAVDALAKLRAAFDELGARLGGRSWLVGDRFTAADLTFASLAALVVRPVGHPGMTPFSEGDAGPLQPLFAEMRATPAGRHAIRTYGLQRHAKIA